MLLFGLQDSPINLQVSSRKLIFHREIFLLDLTAVRAVKSSAMNGTTLLTVSQAATELGLSRQTVQLMLEDRRIHGFILLEKWAIPESEVLRVKEERRQEKVA